MSEEQETCDICDRPLTEDGTCPGVQKMLDGIEELTEKTR